MDLTSRRLYQLLDSSKDNSPALINIGADSEIRKAYLLQGPARVEKLRDIAFTRRILLDPAKRSIYDDYGMAGIQLSEMAFGSRLLQFHLGLRNSPLTTVFILNFATDLTYILDYGKEAFPDWVVTFAVVCMDLALIGNILGRYALDSFIRKQLPFDLCEEPSPSFLDEQGLRMKARNMNTLFSLLNISLLIVFQVLVFLSIADFSGVPLPAVLAPYCILLINLMVQGIIRLFAERMKEPGAVLATVNMALLVYDSLSWKFAHLALAILVILRVDNIITCSWHIVLIPLYIIGLKYLPLLILDYVSVFRIQDVITRRQGRWLLTISTVAFILTSTFYNLCLGVLATRLDGPTAETSTLTPFMVGVWVVLFIHGIATITLVYVRDKTERVPTEAPEAVSFLDEEGLKKQAKSNWTILLAHG
ncbi:hypothetical protein BGX28_001604 [Mortierella sp. GBA30]|nr:hypothetical protein BGX28_001604 [Mortierella sp. GBA30]